MLPNTATQAAPNGSALVPILARITMHRRHSYTPTHPSTHHRRYVRSLEEVVIRTLHRHGIQGHRDDINSGVFVGPDKIAALGVAVKQWTTFHGACVCGSRWRPGTKAYLHDRTPPTPQVSVSISVRIWRRSRTLCRVVCKIAA